ncbi:MAG: hypothetical protein V3R83_09840 [Gammaproteobacteria bacterium]
MRIEFGSTATDEVTGFTGKVTGRTEYMSGCIQYCLEFIHEGKPEREWFDAARLGSDETLTGGPHPSPPKSAR